MLTQTMAVDAPPTSSTAGSPRYETKHNRNAAEACLPCFRMVPLKLNAGDVGIFDIGYYEFFLLVVQRNSRSC